MLTNLWDHIEIRIEKDVPVQDDCFVYYLYVTKWYAGRVIYPTERKVLSTPSEILNELSEYDVLSQVPITLTRMLELPGAALKLVYRKARDVMLSVTFDTPSGKRMTFKETTLDEHRSLFNIIRVFDKVRRDIDEGRADTSEFAAKLLIIVSVGLYVVSVCSLFVGLSLILALGLGAMIATWMWSYATRD